MKFNKKKDEYGTHEEKKSFGVFFHIFFCIFLEKHFEKKNENKIKGENYLFESWYREEILPQIYTYMYIYIFIRIIIRDALNTKLAGYPARCQVVALLFLHKIRIKCHLALFIQILYLISGRKPDIKLDIRISGPFLGKM